MLVAPDSFKGTYTAAQVAHAVAAGVRAAGAAAVERPLADGGEGTMDALATALGMQRIPVATVDAWGDPVEAGYALGEDGLAVVELAVASGIALPHAGPRDPRAADTAGTGILIAAAAARGARHILVAAGGSATTDGGAGAIEAIRTAGGLHGARLTVLADVVTCFEDAATVFGPQKGASPDDVAFLTARLHDLAARLSRDPRGVPRTGAAGGFAGGMWAVFDAELVSGAATVLDTVGFDDELARADAVVVGEGRLDEQTTQGKLIDNVLQRVDRRRPGTPVFAVVGSVSASLGGYADRFAGILIAGDEDRMRAAGAEVASRVGH